MSNLSPAAVLYDSSGTEKGTGSNPVTVNGDLVVTNAAARDVFGAGVSAVRYNQVEVDYATTAPTAITDITVTATSGGSSANLNGQAVFSTGTSATGGIKAVTNTSITYRPHSEIYAAFTCIFTTGVASSYQRIGIYDASNGFFVGYEGTSFGVTIRKAGVDTTTPRASFNVDTLTGGASSQYTRNGIPETMDPTKDQLYRIRYGWLGAAPIYYEILSPDGEWVLFHIIRHPNTTAGTTVNNPLLPITLDAQKTAGATNITMSTACWAGGSTSNFQKITDTITANTLATLGRSVITGQTTGGGGGFVNVKVTPSGAMNVAATQDTSPWVVSGTVTANLGTIAGVATETTLAKLPLTQGSTTSGQSGALVQGAVTTAAPTYTTAQTSPLSLTTAGALRTDSSATTQPVSGTVTAEQATAANLNATVVQSTAANLRSQTSSEANTGATPPTQGSLGMGSVTTAAPTYTTGTANALSLTTTGALRVDNTASTQPVSGTVTSNQGTAAALAGRWPVQVTDGTNVMPTGDVAARAGYIRVTDGTNVMPVGDVATRAAFTQISDNVTGPVAVKAASTPATVTDKSLVVQVSPNQEPIPTTLVPTNAFAGNAQARTASLAANTFTAIRQTAYTEQTTNAQRSFSSSSANDSAAGTGARQIRIEYLDATGSGPSLTQPFYTETITLNGTTAVNTVNNNICFIEHIEVVSVGSGGFNAGTITMFAGTGGTGATIGTIGVGNLIAGSGDNEVLWAHHYVPNLFECAVYTSVGGCYASAGGGAALQFLRGKTPTSATSAEMLVGDIISVGQGNAAVRQFGAPLLFTGPYRIVLYGTTLSNNTSLFGSFDFSDRPA